MSGNDQKSKRGFSRNTFLSALGWGSIAALFGAFAHSFVRFYRPQVLYEPPQFFKAGHPDEYPVGSVSTRWIDDQRVWIVRTEKGIYALIAKCTHLGCTPTWFEPENRFMCPCHGTNFSREGDVISGPAPKPLFRAAITLADDAQLLVNKARKENRKKHRDQDDFLLRLV